jgi:hypothetical protein
VVAENATVTVDGNPYVVPLTAGTVQVNAYEIATYLDANVPGYGFTSNDDKVFALAQLPDFGAGAFAFSSATAVAAWVQIQNGTIPTETWISQDDWNVNPDIAIDPLKGNVYQIQLQYLGYGGIIFWAENPETSMLEIVHIIHYASTETRPSVKNPIFRIGWAARNTGNTTDIVVKGASGGAFVEGVIVIDAIPRGISTTQLAVTVTRTNVLAIRNRLTFNSTSNRAEALPQSLLVTTDSTKTAIFEIIQDPVLSSGALDFQFIDGNLSLMESAVDASPVTGGTVIASFPIKLGDPFSIPVRDVFDRMIPGTTYCIAARVTSGAASDMDATFTWKDDL